MFCVRRCFPPCRYSKGEPLSAKGIKAYLLLHEALVESRLEVASRDKTIAQVRPSVHKVPRALPLSALARLCVYTIAVTG